MGARKYPSLSERLAGRAERRGECLIYTAGHESRSGHVQIRDGAREVGVHVAAWEIEHGRPRPDGVVIRHSCDTPRCIEPRHLLAGSIADNNRDRDERGRHVPLRGETNGVAKLTAVDVQAIRRRLDAGEPQASIAADFGVWQQTVSAIATGKRWAHLPAEEKGKR